MIRNETEYQEASERLAQEWQRLAEHRSRLNAAGLEEVESYEKLKRGEFGELDNLRGLGHLLISIRIAQGLSQRELANRLNVHESQVSRDERNEYFGITLERAIRLLDALNVKLRTKVEIVNERKAAVA